MEILLGLILVICRWKLANRDKKAANGEQSLLGKWFQRTADWLFWWVPEKTTNEPGAK